MTAKEHKQIKNLFSLCDEALEDRYIHPKFVDLFNRLREQNGLARLLDKVRKHAVTQGD